ncbi:CLUMA_CG011452, isoform A [Clunio marinus]|uniref:CLUMA_CG011452, isoform A n=1 Tax=Clunio marinus TaxID=568069 RepID=A0A1J1IEV2_9DIPT|nr:CLUMA_CG011452, isoform A [Clunio marinus]
MRIVGGMKIKEKEEIFLFIFLRPMTPSNRQTIEDLRIRKHLRCLIVWISSQNIPINLGLVKCSLFDFNMSESILK